MRVTTNRHTRKDNNTEKPAENRILFVSAGKENVKTAEHYSAGILDSIRKNFAGRLDPEDFTRGLKPATVARWWCEDHPGYPTEQILQNIAALESELPTCRWEVGACEALAKVVRKWWPPPAAYPDGVDLEMVMHAATRAHGDAAAVKWNLAFWRAMLRLQPRKQTHKPNGGPQGPRRAGRAP